MNSVQAKKHLGQHFLNDKNIAKKIVDSLTPDLGFTKVLEVGPGMGVLSDFLIENKDIELHLIDIDTESIAYLEDKYSSLGKRLIHGDFLKLDFQELFSEKFAIIGNFPYNISSQILFKILDNKDQVPQTVGMFQKEVAERCTAQPGSKAYGILSVLLQAYFDIKYLFTVKAGAFNPPPKVLSWVIELKRNDVRKLDCNEALFKKVVKAAFNHRRKTLRNALSVILSKEKINANPIDFLNLRAERLSVEDFINLTNQIEKAL